MDNIYLTVDLEEWYHLEYLRPHTFDRAIETIPSIGDFVKMLDLLGIKATFFVLAELAEQHAKLIRWLNEEGHEIACHGLNHDLLYEKSTVSFAEQAVEAKERIDRVLGADVVKGFRAACFSMDRNKLDTLRSCGYVYDSSYIRFTQHPLYGRLDLDGYRRVSDLVYENEGFYEVEVPTTRLAQVNLPLSSGGYLRLLPEVVTKWLIDVYLRDHSDFLIYVHPFELTNVRLPLDHIPFRERFRAEVGRHNNISKLESILRYLIAKGGHFATLRQVCCQ